MTVETTDHGERIARLETITAALVISVDKLTVNMDKTHHSFIEAVAFGKGIITVLGVIASGAVAVAGIAVSLYLGV